MEKEFRKIYKWIASLLNIDTKKDEKARNILAAMTQHISLEFIAEHIQDRKVIVAGAGPSLPKTFLKHLNSEYAIIAADGATRFLASIGVYPHIVVTDLDGISLKTIQKLPSNTIYVVHAHGDNIEKIKETIPYIKSRKFYATTQVDPLPPVYNFGGFTDGDRAVFLAVFFGAREIRLEGMDFGTIVGKYSKPYYKQDSPADTRKMKKLYIGETLIKWLKCSGAPVIGIGDIECRRKWPWEKY